MINRTEHHTHTAFTNCNIQSFTHCVYLTTRVDHFRRRSNKNSKIKNHKLTIISCHTKSKSTIYIVLHFYKYRIESYSQPKSQPARCDQFYLIFQRAVSNSRGEERESLKGCRTRIPMGIQKKNPYGDAEQESLWGYRRRRPKGAQNKNP